MLIHSAVITGSFQLNNTDVSSITNVAGFATTSSVDSLVVRTGSYASTSSLNELQSKTGSYATTSSVNNLQSVTGSYVTTSSFDAYTGSNDTTNTTQNTRLSTIESVTGSYATTSSVNNLQSVTGSYATTGSNQFNGNQSISGSITSNGTITAQTLVVQTVTSSIEFVTGSTRNGSLSSNTHQFTGSVLMSGSLTGTSATFSDTILITANNSNAYSLNLLGRSADNATTLNFFSNNGTIRYGYIYTEPTTMLFGVSGSTRLAINSTGSVGIGTTSPDALLTVAGTNQSLGGAFNTYGNALIYSTDSYAINKGGSLSFGGKYNASGTPIETFARIHGKKESATDGATSGYLSFETTNDATALLTERMRITSTGNVGIGTTSPQRQFVVSNGGAEGLEISAGSGRTTIISYNRSTSAWLPLVLTEGTGNVLIGTTTDNGNKLQVNGSISAGNISAGTLSVSAVIASSGFRSYAGSVSLASGASATIYTMDTVGLYTVQAIYAGANINFCASAIFYAQSYSTDFVKCLTLYDGANIDLSNSGAAIRVRNDGYATYTFEWTILFQPGRV
jgi:hypothetical protein